MSLRDKKGLKSPRVRIQTVKLPSLDLEKYIEFWKTYCDEVAAIDYKDAENRNKALIDENWGCPQLWQRMTIEWNGSIIPCNNDDFRGLSPGNVKVLTIKESWNAPIVQRARELHMHGKSHLLGSCNGCPWRTTQILKKGGKPPSP